MTFLIKQDEMGWAVSARLTRTEMLPPPPERNPMRCTLPTQPRQPSFSMTRHHKTSCLQISTHKELFLIIFLQEFEPGLSKIHPWRSLDWPLMKYITIQKWKCHLFKFFDARSEGQEVAEEIFSSKEINKLTKKTTTVQQVLRQLKYNTVDSMSSPASQIGKLQVMLQKSGWET